MRGFSGLVVVWDVFADSQTFGSSSSVPTDLLLSIILSKALLAISLHITKEWLLTPLPRDSDVGASPSQTIVPKVRPTSSPSRILSNPTAAITKLARVVTAARESVVATAPPTHIHRPAIPTTETVLEGTSVLAIAAGVLVVSGIVLGVWYRVWNLGKGGRVERAREKAAKVRRSLIKANYARLNGANRSGFGGGYQSMNAQFLGSLSVLQYAETLFFLLALERLPVVRYVFLLTSYGPFSTKHHARLDPGS